MWMALDLGTITGVAWSVVEPWRRAAMAEALGKGRVPWPNEAPVGVREFDSGAKNGMPERMYTGKLVDTIFELEEWLIGLCAEHGESPRDVTLIIEDFLLRGGEHSAGREQISSAVLGGMVEIGLVRNEWSRLYGARVVKQQPSEAKLYATNQRLKEWGLWTPHKRDHVKDAMRHLVLFGAKQTAG